MQEILNMFIDITIYELHQTTCILNIHSDLTKILWLKITSKIKIFRNMVGNFINFTVRWPKYHYLSISILLVIYYFTEYIYIL